MLNLQEIQIILQLLERVSLNGKEANTFLQVVTKLQKLAHEMAKNEPKPAEEKPKNK